MRVSRPALALVGPPQRPVKIQVNSPLIPSRWGVGSALHMHTLPIPAIRRFGVAPRDVGLRLESPNLSKV